MSELKKSLFEVQKYFSGLKKNPLVKTKKVDYSKSGKGGAKYSYLPFPELNIILDPILLKFGIIVRQPLYGDGIKTIIQHENGETEEHISSINMTYNSAQNYGIAISYQKRYAKLSALGLYTLDEDMTDGKELVKESNNSHYNAYVDKNPAKPEFTADKLNVVSFSTWYSDECAVRANGDNWSLRGLILRYYRCGPTLLTKAEDEYTDWKKENNYTFEPY